MTTAKKRKPGRPSGKTYEPRKILALTAGDWALVEAKRKGLSKAEFCREAVREKLGLT